MEYASLVDVYEKIEGTDSTIEKRDILADLFIDSGSLLPTLVVLVRGHLFPAHNTAELGISSSLTLEAIVKTTGIEESDIGDRWQETGDLGDAANCKSVKYWRNSENLTQIPSLRHNYLKR